MNRPLPLAPLPQRGEKQLAASIPGMGISLSSSDSPAAWGEVVSSKVKQSFQNSVDEGIPRDYRGKETSDGVELNLGPGGGRLRYSARAFLSA